MVALQFAPDASPSRLVVGRFSSYKQRGSDALVMRACGSGESSAGLQHVQHDERLAAGCVITQTVDRTC